MKNNILFTSIIVSAIIIFIGVGYWHMQERKAWSKWKRQGLYIIYCMDEKKRATNWSEERIKAYGDSIEESIGREVPSECPYCFVQSMLK
jgi:hypothetical protein